MPASAPSGPAGVVAGPRASAPPSTPADRAATPFGSAPSPAASSSASLSPSRPAAAVLLFGHGVPLDAPVVAGLDLADITRRWQPESGASRIAPMLEPFLDPFVRAFLNGLEAQAFDAARAIVVWRQGPGALHAYRYAQELRRLGLLPPGPPLILWNHVTGGAAAEAFNRTQEARLADALATLPRTPPPDRTAALATLEAMQAAGAIPGAEAFARRLAARATGAPVDTGLATAPHGPRLALAGAPLGGTGLHQWLDRQGRLVLDLQGPDAPAGDPGALMTARGVEVLVWQVDPNDDLHGWRRPAMAALCAARGIRFVDLGHVPAWPAPADLPGTLA